jgi:Mg2+-importing ATPase
VIATVLVGMLLPYTPLAAPLGFTPLPLSFWFILALMTTTYLGLVEIVKRRLFGNMLD